MLNPPRRAGRRCSGSAATFRVGDKVMQTQNNYSGGVQRRHRPGRRRSTRSSRSWSSSSTAGRWSTTSATWTSCSWRTRCAIHKTPGERVPGGGDPAAHAALHDAAAEPALHRHHPRARSWWCWSAAARRCGSRSRNADTKRRFSLLKWRLQHDEPGRRVGAATARERLADSAAPWRFTGSRSHSSPVERPGPEQEVQQLSAPRTALRPRTSAPPR